MELSLAQPPQTKSPTRTLVVLLAITTSILISLVLVYWVLTSVGNIQVLSPRQEIQSQMAGRVKIPVQKGQTVSKGQPLILINAEKYKLALEQEELKLTQSEALLPPGYDALQVPGSFAETSTARLKELIAKEELRREELNAASAQEGRTAYEFRKLQNKAQQASTPAEKEQLIAAVAVADGEYQRSVRETTKAKLAFEEVSLARATVELERKRMERMQRENGASAIPESTRVRLYTVQKAKRDEAKAAYEAAMVTARYAGIVEEIYVKTGQEVAIGEPLLLVTPTHDYSITITADTLALNIPKQKTQVEVTIPAYSSTPLQGEISTIIPSASISGIQFLDPWLPEGLRKVRLIMDVPITQAGPVIPEGASVTLNIRP